MREKIEEIIKRLEPLYPNAGLELKFKDPFQLLVGAILAAQESDKKINSLGDKIFEKYKSPKDIAQTPLEELEEDLKSVNFYRRKAKLLKSCCSALVSEFGGEVPKSVDEMTKLPGVGRKTANMVLGGSYNLPAIIVDRHFLRVSQRLGLTDKKDPDKVEMDLLEVVPENMRTKLSMLLINHGKKVCTARNPKCEECPLKDLCAYYNS